jgi:hypothetical protein
MMQSVILLYVPLAIMHPFPALIRFAAFANVEQYWQSVVNDKVNAGIPR